MSRHDSLIIKDTHRGLLYTDGVFRDLLPAGRYQIPRPPSRLAKFFGRRVRSIEVVLVDVRGRDRTVVIQELLTADGATISASFVMHYRVVDPLAALHHVKDFEGRLDAEAQTAARRLLRCLSVEEVMASRDEIGEEVLRQLQESASDYGLGVTGLDFKDLHLPEGLRMILNGAVIATRFRQLPTAEGPAIGAAGAADGSAPAPPIVDRMVEGEDDPDVGGARAAFDGDRKGDPLPPAPSSRPAGGKRPRGKGAAVNTFDVALHRCRP